MVYGRLCGANRLTEFLDISKQEQNYNTVRQVSRQNETRYEGNYEQWEITFYTRISLEVTSSP